jgi:hypothetical protein
MEKNPYQSTDKYSIGKYYTIPSNKHFDILAYGKLLYNIITQSFSFYPGWHYNLEQEYLKAIDMIQDIDPISKNALQKCFMLNGESENLDNDLSEAIKALYRMLTNVPRAHGPPVVVD